MVNINELSNVEISGLMKSAFWEAAIKVKGENVSGDIQTAETNVSGYLSYLTNQINLTNENILKYLDNQFTYVSDIYGNDETGELYNIEKPFKTFQAAFEAVDVDGFLLIKDGFHSVSSAPVDYGSKTVNIYVNVNAGLTLFFSAVYQNATVRFFGDSITIFGNSEIREGGDLEIYTHRCSLGQILLNGGNLVVDVSDGVIGIFNKTDGSVVTTTTVIVRANTLRLANVLRSFRPSNDRTCLNLNIKIKATYLEFTSETFSFDLREMQNINISIEAEKIVQNTQIPFFTFFEISGTRPIKNNQIIISCKEFNSKNSLFGDFVRAGGTSSNYFNNNFIIKADYFYGPSDKNLIINKSASKFYSNAGGEQFSFVFTGNFTSESLPLIDLGHSLGLNMIFEGTYQVFQDGISVFQSTAGVITANCFKMNGCQIRNTGAAPISLSALTDVVVVKDARISNTVNANVNVNETQGNFLVY